MTGQVQLPDMIDPDAPYVEFRANQCRECGEAGPVLNVSNPAWHEWFTKHRNETGHSKFFEYKIARSAGQEATMPVRRRRTLGQRGV